MKLNLLRTFKTDKLIPAIMSQHLSEIDREIDWLVKEKRNVFVDKK